MIVFQNERIGKWMEERGGGEYRIGSQCIGLERDGKLVAGVMYDWHNGASVYMHVAAEGKNWLTREFLWYVFDYPFNQLNCNVVIGLVAEDNKAAQKFDEHIGFKEHARIKKGHPSGDLIVYTMYREDCRWIDEQTKSPQNT